MTNGKIRIGITGSGFMALTHAEAAARLAETEPVAVAGGSRAPRLAASYGLRVEADADCLARSPDVDAVIVTTPHAIHAREALAAIEAGKHVLVEKPMTTSIEDCDRILAAAARRGVVVSVGYHQRFRQNNRRAHELVRAGAIGRLLAFQVAMPLPFTILQGDSGFAGSWTWWNNPESLGHVINGGPHAVDMLRWLFDTEVAGVSALCRTLREEAPVERTTVALLELANGAVGTLFSTCEVAPPGFPGEEFRFRFAGTSGSMDLDAYGELRVTEDGKWSTVAVQPAVGHLASSTILNPVRMQSFTEQLLAFVEAIRGAPPRAGTGADGRAGVAACLAMLEASRTESVVRLGGARRVAGD